MGDHYDKQGNPLSLMEWAKLFEDRSYQRVRSSFLAGTHVSTVWMGIDHGWGQGDPVIFETMVFSEDEELDQMCERYCTEDEAIIGHIAMVERVLATFPSDDEAKVAAKSTEAIAMELERS